MSANWSGSSGGGFSQKTAAEMWSYAGSDGEVIYNTTYKHHFKYDGLMWYPHGVPNPQYGFLISDEFTPSVVTSQMGWLNVNTTVTASDQTHQGVFLGRTATASTRAFLASGVNSFMSGTGDFYVEWIAKFPTLATVAEDYSALLGIGDAGAFVSGSLGVDNIGLVYNRGVNGANLIQVTTSNSVSTTTNTSSTIVADTYYAFGVLIKGSSSVEFFLNRVSTGAAHTTNIPTGRGSSYHLRLDKIAGTGNSDYQVDAFNAWGFYNGSRF
jgi:hypothetical protein